MRSIWLVTMLLIPFVLSCTGKSTGEREFQEAEELWLTGKYLSAQEKYKQIIDSYPTSDLIDDSVYKIGEIFYLNLRNPKEAVSYFKTLSYADIDSEYRNQANKYLAEIYETSFLEYDKAIIEYQHLIDTSYAKNEKGIYQLRIAYCYFKKENYHQSIVEFDKFIEEYSSLPDLPQAIYQKANIYYILGQCATAKPVFQEVITRFPESSYFLEAKLGIGECLDEEGDLTGALAVFQELENSYPNKKLIQITIEGLEVRISK